MDDLGEGASAELLADFPASHHKCETETKHTLSEGLDHGHTAVCTQSMLKSIAGGVPWTLALTQWAVVDDDVNVQCAKLLCKQTLFSTRLQNKTTRAHAEDCCCVTWP